MAGLGEMALANLLSPMVLAFALGLVAASLRSDLQIPEPAGKAMAIYLMFAIGLKGGVALAAAEPDGLLLRSLASGIALSFTIPLLAFGLLRLLVPVRRLDAGAIAAHYGSISVVTFAAAVQALDHAAIPYEGHLVAVMALMETPAIITGILLARGLAPGQRLRLDGEVLRHILLNGSVVLLLGGFLIGLATGARGMEAVGPFFVDPFRGVLCLFLLDLGIHVAERLRGERGLGGRLVLFGVLMPLLGGTIGLLAGALIGLSAGGAALLAVLTGSASYIAVPAALRLALPEANPGLAMAASLGVTFPFNVTLGIPLAIAAAGWLLGAESPP